jgi:RNA polymerase sigma factor (sigma-70 family)
MAEAYPNPVLQHIRHLIGVDPAGALTDSELLQRFLATGDETAVEGLVRRYGPLVFGVCRRVLRNDHAAEDVFQATFLILIRKVSSLTHCEGLGSWLYTVAYRLALRARANESRRRQCEAQAIRNRPDTDRLPSPAADVVVALEEELQRLPAQHRAPLALCYLEGKTNAQAAQILGCPPGSISARLERARQRLRERLAQRGYAVPCAGIAALLTADCAPAAVPLPLLDNTVRAALWFAGEKAATGFVSAHAVALARGAFWAMFVNKLRIAAAALLAAAMLGTGATMLLKAAPEAIPPARVPEALPGWAEGPGERLPDGALARMGTTHLRHGDAVFFSAYTPDGKALVTAGKDRTVRSWDLATGREIRRVDWGEAQLGRKAELPEDATLHQYRQQLWDDMALSCQAALSSDGKLVATSQGGAVCLWDAGGKQLVRFQTGEERLVQLVFAADGKSLLTLAPGQASAVWEVATGRCLRRSQSERAASPGLGAFPARVEQIALVSPGWKYLAFQKIEEREYGVWIQTRDLATGQDLSRIETRDGIAAAAMTFSADDRTLIWDHYPGRGIVVSDVATGKEQRRLGGQWEGDGAARYDAALAIAVSADGKSLAVCRKSHTIELWDLVSGKRTYPVGKATNAQLEQGHANDSVGALVRPALAFSSDGKKLVCSLGGATLRQFHAGTGEEIPGPGPGQRGPVSTLALSPDGGSLITYGTGNPPSCWDWATGKQTGQLDVPTSATHAVFPADGRFGFAAGHDFTLCGAGGKKTWKIAAGDSTLVALALSPDGALLASRCWDNPVIHLWDTTTAQQRRSFGEADGPKRGRKFAVTETTGVVSPDLVFSPDGRSLAAAGPRMQLCLWDVATGALLWEETPPAGQAIERFAFSPSGCMLASVHADSTVTLYDAVNGSKRARLGKADPKQRRVHLTTTTYNGTLVPTDTRRDAPVSLAFSPDGRYLATAQETSVIHLWDVLACRKVGQLPVHDGGVASLLFAADGKHLFSGGTDTTALTWNLNRRTRPAPARATPLSPQAVEALWSDLGDPDAARAFDALCQLSASPDQAVTLLRQRLRPAALADPKRMAQLLADLESDRFEVRRQAESELEKLGESAELGLRQALDDAPLDLRQRVERLLDRVSVPTAAPRRDLRAVELLELLGSAEAGQVLRTLAEGEPTARLTSEAVRAVRQLTHRDVKP